MKAQLTKRQSQILDFIKAEIEETGLPPTRREIADKFKWSSSYSAQCHLELMQKKGVIKLSKLISRGIQVL